MVAYHIGCANRGSAQGQGSSMVCPQGFLAGSQQPQCSLQPPSRSPGNLSLQPFRQPDNYPAISQAEASRPQTIIQQAAKQKQKQKQPSRQLANKQPSRHSQQSAASSGQPPAEADSRRQVASHQSAASSQQPAPWASSVWKQ